MLNAERLRQALWQGHANDDIIDYCLSHLESFCNRASGKRWELLILTSEWKIVVWRIAVWSLHALLVAVLLLPSTVQKHDLMMIKWFRSWVTEQVPWKITVWFSTKREFLIVIVWSRLGSLFDRTSDGCDLNLIADTMDVNHRDISVKSSAVKKHHSLSDRCEL